MKKFHRRIVFTKTPLASKYRFKDIFQIYPMVWEHVPSNSHAVHFPCVVEYWHDDSSDPIVTTFKGAALNQLASTITVPGNLLKEICTMLSSVTNHRFFEYPSERSWAAEMVDTTDQDIQDSAASRWSLLTYYYPEMGKDLSISEFTDVTFNETPREGRNEYYHFDPTEHASGYVVFPDEIDILIERYFQLDKGLKLVADSSTYQFCNALDLMKNMKNLSFVAAVSGIETLVHCEYGKVKPVFECSDCKSLKSSSRACKKCGKPILGVTANFREFLNKYVSTTAEDNKIFKKIYDYRSKIVHTEYLMFPENYLTWELSDDSENIHRTHLIALQLFRRAFTSWLLSV